MIPLESRRPPLLLYLAQDAVSAAFQRCLLKAYSPFFPPLPAKNGSSTTEKWRHLPPPTLLLWPVTLVPGIAVFNEQ